MTRKTFSLVSKSFSRVTGAIKRPENCSGASYTPEKRRWLMLAIFICFTFINSVQWGLYIVISDLVQKYYGVSGDMVDNTAVVFYLAYIPLIFPALWLLEKMGIRFCLLVSCAGLCAGDWIKVIASYDTNLFYLVLVGQGMVAAFSVLAFGLAAKVAAVWFGADEVSLACSLAVFGDQLGTACGLFLPSIMVTDGTEQSIGSGLVKLNTLIACSATLILIAAFLLFRKSPESPPSVAQAVVGQQSDSNVFQMIKRVCKMKSFLMMMLAYGIQTACFNAYVPVLNTVLLKYFPLAGDIHVGVISSLMLISGIVASILSGWLLDKTHMYKSLTILLYICALITTAANAFVPQLLILELVYASNILMGFFSGGYYPTGVQLAIEVTFPVSESLVSSLLLLITQGLSIPFTKLYRWLFDEYGYLCANIFMSGALGIGCFLTILTPAKLRRTLANTSPTAPRDFAAE